MMMFVVLCDYSNIMSGSIENFESINILMYATLSCYLSSYTCTDHSRWSTNLHIKFSLKPRKCESTNICGFWLPLWYLQTLHKSRRDWRYQWGNHNPYIEEEQTIQWPKEKVQKDKQRSIKHTHKTNDRVTRTPLKSRGELRCSGRVISSCFTTGTRQLMVYLNVVIGTLIFHRSEFAATACPRYKDVVIVIDSSSSMKRPSLVADKSKFVLAKEAARYVIQTLNPNDVIHSDCRFL
jgi:hypothetical protein